MRLNESNTRLAVSFWREGKTLGWIAEKLGCSVYDLSPWLYADEMHDALHKTDERDPTPYAQPFDPPRD